MVSSARRSRVSGSWAWSGSTATPKLACNRHRETLDHAWLRERGLYPLGDRPRRGHRVEVGEDEGKFVATDAGEQVRRPAGVVHPGGHVAQDLVADVVAQPVVDPLEAVEVDEHDADPLPGAPGASTALCRCSSKSRRLGSRVSESWVASFRRTRASSAVR